MTKAFSFQSEVGKLSSVCLAPVANFWKNQEKIDLVWRELNYAGRPDFNKAVDQYSKFRRIFETEQVKISEFTGNGMELSPDSIYCRDASIMTDFGAILCNMGKSQRSSEPKMHLNAYTSLGVTILGAIQSPGTVEGGDVAWLDSNTLVVGLGYRTNIEGIRQLRGILEKINVTIEQVDLPHHKGPSDVFHIMSIFSPISHKKAVVFSPLMPVRFRNLLLDREIELIEVKHEEYEKMACNVLALSPSKCLMVEGCNDTQKAIEKAGIEVISYKGSEISIKGGGGPTCLTRPLLRAL